METAQEKTVQPQPSIKTGAVVNKPTSPDQIHEDAAAAITNNLTRAGHPISLENVKSDQTFKVTPDMEKLGVEPSGLDISPKDVIRNIREEIEGEPKGTDVVESSVLRRLRAGRQKKIINFFRKLGLKKAA